MEDFKGAVDMGAYGGTDVASRKWVIPGAVLVIR